MKGGRAEKLRKVLDELSPAGKTTFLSLVAAVVDSTLHHLLRTLQNDSHVRIAVSLGSTEVSNLAKISDGLAGELYSDEGWIARFSKEIT